MGAAVSEEGEGEGIGRGGWGIRVRAIGSAFAESSEAGSAPRSLECSGNICRREWRFWVKRADDPPHAPDFSSCLF